MIANDSAVSCRCMFQRVHPDMIWPPHQDVRPSWGQPAMGAFPQQSHKVHWTTNLNSDKVIQNVSQLCSVAAVGIKVGWGNVEVNVLLRFWSQCSSQKDRQKCYKCRKSSDVLSITSLWRNSDISLQSVYQNGSKFCIFLIFFSCFLCWRIEADFHQCVVTLLQPWRSKTMIITRSSIDPFVI